MTIIAVIPARSGSRGVPNKNTRIISGKPMISYAIENALESCFVDRTIVISDSEEIETIAFQYGVTYKKEDEMLCKGEVTLDEVVCEAVRDEEYDYVVT